MIPPGYQLLAEATLYPESPIKGTSPDGGLNCRFTRNAHDAWEQGWECGLRANGEEMGLGETRRVAIVFYFENAIAEAKKLKPGDKIFFVRGQPIGEAIVVATP